MGLISNIEKAPLQSKKFLAYLLSNVGSKLLLFWMVLKQESDVVITMGCGDACPIFPGKRYEDWELQDPAGQDIETVRQIRDEIKSRIENLLAELSIKP